MPKLTLEAFQEEMIDSTDLVPGVKIVRQKKTEEIIFGPSYRTHKNTATEERIPLTEVAYAGELITIKEEEKTRVEMYSGGRSLSEYGYVYNPEEEATTATIIINMLAEIDEQAEFSIEEL